MNKIAKIVLAIAAAGMAASSAYVIRKNADERAILNNRALQDRADLHIKNGDK
jgi:hypothetical protein